MNNILYDILNNVNEGIIILNEKLEICFWNNYMERLTKTSKDKAVNNNIYKILPNLNRNYFNGAIDNILRNGCKMFFSAAMHKGLVNNKENLNFKISRFDKDESKFLLLEFIDVTNQFIQINILKDYVHKLYKVNKQLQKKEKIIKKLAYYDKLTGVANRILFYKIGEKVLSSAKKNNELLGLIFVDVDKFKNINDKYGHKVGDKVLIKVANILKKITRKNDLVARYGGDEFLILLPCIKKSNDYNSIVSRIINSRNKVIKCNGKKINISLSMGASLYPYDGASIDKLILEADKAMYFAKRKDGQDICSG